MEMKLLKKMCFAALVHLTIVGAIPALEIYRIGGAGAPKPAASNEVRFHQLHWSDFTEKTGLEEEALAAGVLQPFFLDADENIALTTPQRGGGPHVSGNVGYYVNEKSLRLVDGDPATFYDWVETTKSLERNETLRKHRITMELGGVFQVNRVRLFTAMSGHYPDQLDISTHPDFSVSRSLSLRGKIIANVLENVRDTIDVSFPPQLAGSVGLLLHRITPKAVILGEIEVYGQGYVGQASYVGDFIDLGEPAIWGQLRWRGSKDPGARVFIQTRAGKDDDPNMYWRFTGRGSETTSFDEKGKLLTASTYARLKPGEGSEITYDTANWSFWSPYEFADSSGTNIFSPAPNSVFQLKVDFLSTYKDGSEVEFIEFSATKPPLAEEVVGEIHPTRVPLGETARLTLVLTSTIRAQHSGFDQIEIATPFGLSGVDSLKIGGLPVEPRVTMLKPDSTLFSLQLPHRLAAGDSGELVEVQFRAPVLRYGTPFNAWVRDSERPGELAQQINPGDASLEVESESFVIRTTLSKDLLADLQVEPRLITPNGDGMNEEVSFSGDLMQLTERVPLTLGIFDLSGRLLKTQEDLSRSGKFNFTWDGRATNGRLVPPGGYLYQIAVEAESGEEQLRGSLSVVY